MAEILTIQWQDWITDNIQRGCQSADLVKAMSESGFDPSYAETVVSVFVALISRVKDAGLPHSPKKPYLGYSRISENRSQFFLAGQVVSVACYLRNPQIVVFENLLSDSECEMLMDMAKTRMSRSSVVDPSTGHYTEIEGRTSDGAHFSRGETPEITAIESRIAQLTGIDAVRGEPIQVLRYRPGGQYLPHHDYFPVEDPGSQPALAQGGQRVATVVMYLSDVDEGGDTDFPSLGLAVKPRRGSAVYFEYFDRNGETDSRLLHAGTPVVRGEKWIATKWLRERQYGG